MSHDPLTPLWARLESVRPVFFHAELDRTLTGCREWLVRTGVLAETTPSLYGQCAECGNGNLVPAVRVPGSRSGRDEWRLPCPACGPVPIDGDSLRRWAVDVPALLACVAAAAGIKDARAEVVENHLWFVGTAAWGCPTRSVYFARATHVRAREAAAAALRTHPRAVLLHATEHALRLWGAATPHPTVALESVVTLGPGGLAFDTGAVLARLADAPPDPPRPPVPKRAVRAEKIARLTAEAVEHLRRARAHAFATRDLSPGRGAELLPRPTMSQLGELVGLKAYEVSRCFADRAARELNLYWEMASDLGAVMAFAGPISTGPTE